MRAYFLLNTLEKKDKISLFFEETLAAAHFMDEITNRLHEHVTALTLKITAGQQATK